MEGKLSDDRNVGIREIQKHGVSHRKLLREGSLTGILAKHGDCGWSVVQLAHDGEIGPMQWFFQAAETDTEVQRTTHSAEMTAFWMDLNGLSAPATIHTDNIHWPERKRSRLVASNLGRC